MSIQAYELIQNIQYLMKYLINVTKINKIRMIYQSELVVFITWIERIDSHS